jgi:hypothetical protein
MSMIERNTSMSSIEIYDINVQKGSTLKYTPYFTIAIFLYKCFMKTFYNFEKCVCEKHNICPNVLIQHFLVKCVFAKRLKKI